MGQHWRTSRTTPSGGIGQLSGSPHAPRTQRDLNPLPSQSILHCEDISYPPLNVGCVIRDAILGTIAAVALAVSVFIILRWFLFG